MWEDALLHYISATEEVITSSHLTEADPNNRSRLSVFPSNFDLQKGVWQEDVIIA